MRNGIDGTHRKYGNGDGDSGPGGQDGHGGQDGRTQTDTNERSAAATEAYGGPVSRMWVTSGARRGKGAEWISSFGGELETEIAKLG